MSNENFPVQPIEDWIIVKKINIEDLQKKTASKLDVELVGGMSPKNPMELEKQKMQEASSYAESEKKMLARWDAHPNQGIVKAVGPGRMSENGVLKSSPVKVGDHIYLRGQTGEPVIVKKKLYWMHKPHEIFAIADV
jgi:co-chaperonin GroES (HSP10)